MSFDQKLGRANTVLAKHSICQILFWLNDFDQTLRLAKHSVGQTQYLPNIILAK
jgi:hypothetical protein